MYVYFIFFLGPFQKLCLGISVLWQTCFVKKTICSWTCWFTWGRAWEQFCLQISENRSCIAQGQLAVVKCY